MRIDVSARTIRFPSNCCCCGGYADTEVEVSNTRYTGKRVVRSTTKGWHIPYCRRCTEHVRMWDKRGAGGFVVLGLILSLATCIAAWPLAIVILVSSIIVALIVGSRREAAAKAACSPDCACPGNALEYRGWSGSIHSFEIQSRDYAASFMLANGPKLVNVRQDAATLLSETTCLGAAPSSMPLPKLLTSSESPKAGDDESGEFLKWVSKIESLKGPASRRAALDAGLQALRTEEGRKRLLVEASKIEAQAALDKADSLKMRQAKKRTIQAALDAIRSDPVPDELQQEQIRWLEEALAELDEEAA